MAEELSVSATAAPAAAPSADVVTAVETPTIIGPVPLPSKTAEEMYEELKSTPFFMTEPDPEIAAAFQAMAYEGTPLENASEFKSQGNEQFKAKKFADAREFYGRAVECLVVEEQKRGKEGDGDVEERALLESCYANRAACQLELGNYRATWLDAGRALKINPRNVKCWYRSSKALLAVDRLEDAEDAAKRGMLVDPTNVSLKGVLTGVQKRRDTLAEKKRREEERIALAKRREQLVETALAARNIRRRKSEKPPEMADAFVRLVPDEDDPASSLVIPTMLLYPTDYESDFIKGWNELDTIEDHLSYIFPLPWDKDDRYSIDGVELYAETSTGGLMKLGKKLNMLRILSGGKIDLVDDMMKIFVVPRGKASSWVTEFKAAKAKQLAAGQS